MMLARKWQFWACAGAVLMVGALLVQHYRYTPPQGDGDLAVVPGPAVHAEPSAAASAAGIRSSARDEVPRRPKASPPESSDYADALVRHGEMKSMHDLIRAEGRDEAWAGRAEEYFADKYARLIGAADSDWRPTIYCGTTLCEVSGVLPEPATDKGGQVQENIQSADLMMDGWEHGYHHMGSLFTSGKSGKEFALFYFRREAPVSFNPDAYSPGWKRR